MTISQETGEKKGIFCSFGSSLQGTRRATRSAAAPLKNEPPYSFFAADLVARGDLLALSFHLVSGDFVAYPTFQGATRSLQRKWYGHSEGRYWYANAEK